jgi:phage shock protein E
MQTSILLLLAAIIVVAVIIMRSGQISVRDARAYLRKGALLIDVRTAAEFVYKHLPKAINLPLSELDAEIVRRVPDRSQILLLYCHSGMRGVAARRKLNALGYTHAYNLGSYQRAVEIVKGS